MSVASKIQAQWWTELHGTRRPSDTSAARENGQCLKRRQWLKRFKQECGMIQQRFARPDGR